MATTPSNVTLTNVSQDVLNVIRNNASVNYQNYVPKATEDAESLRSIGTVIMDNPSLQNEFLNALVNRIGRVLITSKTYYNPWTFFKKGTLELGETIEEIFVNIAQPYEFDTDVAESELYKKEIPDVRAAFHVMNYQKFYKATVTQVQLRQAFLSWQGITDLIAGVVNAMYTGSNYDEYLTMKYLLAKKALLGELHPVQIAPVSTANMNSIVSTIKGMSNKFEFLSSEYNLAGIENYSMKDEQYLIVNAQFDATMDVEVLASAFNMDKAQFSGRRVLVDSFSFTSKEIERLGKLLGTDAGYVEFSDDELALLDTIPAVLLDKEWFMIFDNLQQFTENYNGQGMYWNYFFHVWKTFSSSPYSNNALFVPGTPEITDITVSPSTVTLSPGTSVQLSVDVETDYFASQTVKWTLNCDDTLATIDNTGKVTVSADVSTTTSITATATSVYDSTQTSTCVITVSVS